MRRTRPRNTDDAKFKAAFALAKRFPGVELSTSYGTPAIKVKGKFMARLRIEAEGWLAIRCEFLLRDILLNAQPDVFHLTDHYRGYPVILVDLEKINRAALLDILEQGWRMSASKKLLREYDEGPKTRRKKTSRRK
jgi:hypothetical protein